MNPPFNGDPFIADKTLSLRDRFSITDAVETGTYLGGTSRWLAANFRRCFTVDLDPAMVHHTVSTGVAGNLAFFYTNSPEMLRTLSGLIHHTAFVYLDAHWNEYWPLLDELDALAEWPSPPVIAIHDFKVPGEPELGYDSYQGKDLDLEYVTPSMERIYGPRGYSVELNGKSCAAGAMRGIAYFTPA